jgi:hypothetical protein
MTSISHETFKTFIDKTNGLDNYYILINAIASSALYITYDYREIFSKLMLYLIYIIIILFWYYMFARNASYKTLVISLFWWILLSYAANVTGNTFLYILKKNN